ncbi:GrpB family protein [Oscillospiraceae bacterium MB08-C2-2]|nr:GrpB family protein [Oscillospiraceae bacterium MB08-C2-2]
MNPIKRNLSEMTLEELWALFPICLTPHQPCWMQWYAEELHRLEAILPTAEMVRISHIGSTAVKTIWAKPIVDILVETVYQSDWGIIQSSLLKSGYLCMSDEKQRISFNKGYTPEGFEERVYHLHLRRAGDHDELYFRDYLMDHPQSAKAYEALKLDLWKRFEHNRDAYTQSKTQFIQEHTAKAKELYKNRYN